MKLCLFLIVLCAVSVNAQLLFGIQSDDDEQSNQTAQVSTEDYVRAYRQSDPVKSKQAFDFIAGDKDRFAAIFFEDLIRGDVEIRKRALKLLQKWGAPVDSIDLEKRRRVDSKQIGMIDRWLFPVEIIGGNTGLNQQQRDKLVALIDALANGKTKIDQASVESISVQRSFAIDLINEKLAKNKSEPALKKLNQLRYLLLAGKQLRKQHFDNLQMLASTVPETRVDALRSVLQSTARYDRPLISQLLGDKDEQVRATAINGLEVFEIWSTEQALEKLIGDDSSQVRSAAMSYISMCPSIEIQKMVAKQIVSETETTVVLNMLDYLNRNDDPAVVDIALQFVDHADPAIRKNVCRLIRQALDPSYDEENKEQVIEAVNSLVLDDNIEVAREAARLFFLKTSEDSVNILLDTVKKHPEIFSEYAHFIDWYFAFDDEFESDEYWERREQFAKVVLNPRLVTLASDSNVEIRVAAVNLLAKFGKPALKSRLTHFLGDESAKVRIATLKFIADETRRMRVDWRPNRNGIGTDSDIWLAPDRLMAESASQWISEFWSTIKRAFSIPIFGMKIGTVVPHNVDELPPLYHERWIEKYILAMKSVPWIKRINPKLRALARSKEQEEAGWASICLIASGDVEEGIDSLMLVEDPAFYVWFDGVLFSWVPYRERRLLLRKLHSLDPGELGEMYFSNVRNYKAIDELWEFYVESRNPTWCSEILDIAYFGQIGYELIKRDSENAALLDKFKADLDEKITGDESSHHGIALVLMRKYFPEEASAHAKKFIEVSEDKDVKSVAAEIMLELDDDHSTTAMKFLKSDEAVFVKAALRHLLFNDPKSKSIEIEVPSGLKQEHIRRWRNTEDQELEVFATAMLIHLGDNQDVQGLMKYLRVNSAEEQCRMVIRAIAKTGRDENVKYLREIYEGTKPIEIGDDIFDRKYGDSMYFIDTLTSNMIGPKALELRARIRKENNRGSALVPNPFFN